MKPTSTVFAAIATILLHAGLVAAVVAELSSRHEPPTPNAPLKIDLVKPAPLPSAPAAPPQSTAPTSPPPLKPHPPKPHAVADAKPTAPLHETAPARRAAQETAADARPAPSVAPSSVPALAAPAAAAPAPSPPAPVRTAPTDASYASSNRRPPYPRLSQANREEGTPLLRVLVKADGSAGEVQVLRSSGYPLLDESARSTVQGWRFKPATVDGQPVAEWYQLEVPFKLLNN